MKLIFPLLAGVMIIFNSCSSTQKASQTPDDVYYSPGAAKAVSASNQEQDEYYSTAPSDQYVRLKVQNQSRWSYFDDYNAYDSYYAPVGLGYGGGYGYGGGFGYGLGYGMGFGMSALSFTFGNPYLGWSNYYMWNSCYNPYFYNPYYGGGYVVVNPKVPGTSVVPNHLRSINGSSYTNGFAGGTGIRSANNRYYRPVAGNNTSSYQSGGRSGNGNQYRTVNGNGYRPSNNGYSNGNQPATRSTYYQPSNQSSQPTRSYSPPPSSGGGGGGGVSRPGRH